MSQEFDKMANGQIASETIALTEKKVGMALDDIIKMSKNATNKGRKQGRTSNKSRAFSGDKANVLRLRRYMDSRSAVRQGAFAKRRSNFQGNQFTATNEVAKKAAAAPIRTWAFSSGNPSKSNKSRFKIPPAQRHAKEGFDSKWNQGPQEKQAQQPENGMGRQRTQPQTLDSLFANMKEQRIMTFSSQQKGSRNARSNTGRRGIVPWARGRFGI